MTRQNAEHAQQANRLMEETQRVVDRANTSMKDLHQSIDKITQASDQTARIIKTIDEIAFQTNLLALNAAVEAARAGDAGMGFAVVADEVRNLAQKAAESARNTQRIIEENIENIREGSELVVATDDAFDKVAESAKKVAELVGEIAAASREQAQGIEQLNQGVAQMDKVVQQNAANAEQSASASEELWAQAENLQKIVHGLMTLVDGNRRRVTEPSTKSSPGTGDKSIETLPSGIRQKTRGKQRPLNPEEVIPFDDEDGEHFQEF
jgi:methyl-accepting chemotaxis protein